MAMGRELTRCRRFDVWGSPLSPCQLFTLGFKIDGMDVTLDGRSLTLEDIESRYQRIGQIKRSLREGRRGVLCM